MLNETEAIRQQRYKDLRWARRNEKLQQEHEGKLVVVRKHQVVVVGEDRAELLRQAADLGYPREELVVVEMLPLGFEVPPDMLK